MNLNEKITQLREEKRISRSEMADRLNMSSQSYWNIETGKTELTVSRLHKIAEMLGVSVLELMTGEPQKVEDTGKVRELEKRVRELEEIVQIQREDRNRLSDYFSGFVRETIIKIVTDSYVWSDLPLFQGDDEDGFDFISFREKTVENVVLKVNLTNDIIAKVKPLAANILYFLIRNTTDSKYEEMMSIKSWEASSFFKRKIYTGDMHTTSEAILEYVRTVRSTSKEENPNEVFKGLESFAKHLTIEQESLLKFKRENFRQISDVYSVNTELIFKPDGWKHILLQVSEFIKEKYAEDEFVLIKKIIDSGIIKDSELSNSLRQ